MCIGFYLANTEPEHAPELKSTKGFTLRAPSRAWLRAILDTSCSMAGLKKKKKGGRIGVKKVGGVGGHLDRNKVKLLDSSWI